MVTSRRCVARRTIARLRRDDLHAPITALPARLRAHAGEILQRLVNDATVARAHRIERDDFAFLRDARAETLRHLRELIFVTRAITFRVDRDVLAILARAMNHARRQVLNRFEHRAALSDDATRVGAL